ncbi:mismatch-specific DNA-glycosylase [Pullulanibacillus sp. KACC 23026]|uniref:mismatch-specific DNA-glycosylase n=1 Tax=Pullulanibacillus sp. KACC 23026 TaxID=3028315 RepID=UPI0023AE9D63|nr:mismatch-specific DNA-glycosylase [Pullulanibacillus sp. KACC 23026]WEG10846.1 mismatch-specific DNA-glycosylase [Pullulanibacillus sp. KACC 23026]
MPYLPDYLKHDLTILFIGFNPSIKSGESGHHYANPTNRFYKLLEQSGLLLKRIRPEEDSTLLNYGYGLTNIVEKPTRAASDLTKADYEAGRDVLLKKLIIFKPKIACYVGKGVYERMTSRRPIPWGKQTPSLVPHTIDFVVPSSSGLVRMPFEEMVEFYSSLKEEADHLN